MKKINEQFVCIHCKNIVPKASRTCRNHCPFCFVSLHVDEFLPGDRKSQCKGKMYPIMYKIAHGEIKILFQCSICKKLHRNKKASDDQIENLDELISLYKNFFE